MKTCTVCKLDKILKEFGKDKKGKDGLKSLCRGCKAIQDAEYFSSHKKEISFYGKVYRDRERERISAQRAIHTAENKDRLHAYERSWRLANPGKTNAKTARRRAARRKALLKWLTPEHHRQMEMLYIEAAKLTKETGIPHEVDHIIPLQGFEVKGLHVPWNLRIITRTENRHKSRKLIRI